MRTIEIRRHTYTKQSPARGRGSHLSQKGVALARFIGSAIGPFEYVATSQVPRTLETAIAMGFAIDDLLDLGGELWEAAQAEFAHRQWRDDPQLHARYHAVMRTNGGVAALGRRQVQLWQALLTHVQDGGQGLLISHGGLIEPGLVAALPDWQHERWGRGFRHGEGVRLRHDGTRFFDADILFLDEDRVSQP